MKIQIKNRYTQEIIIEGEAKNLKEFLEKEKITKCERWILESWISKIKL